MPFRFSLLLFADFQNILDVKTGTSGEKKQDWIEKLAKFVQVGINVCTHHIQ